jgi:predicted RNA-binding protein with PIN domain
MHYLIDGYNLLFRLIDSKKNLQTQRQTVILSLQKEFAALHFKGTIVFDGSHRRGEQSGLSYKSPLTIAYSPEGETADEYILEKLSTARQPSEITVVTDDRSLASQARGYKAHTLTLRSFLAHLEKSHAKRRKKREEIRDQRPFRESPNEIDRLLKIFEDRLQHPNE